jgi:hypothetical protein
MGFEDKPLAANNLPPFLLRFAEILEGRIAIHIVAHENTADLELRPRRLVLEKHVVIGVKAVVMKEIDFSEAGQKFRKFRPAIPE